MDVFTGAGVPFSARALLVVAVTVAAVLAGRVVLSRIIRPERVESSEKTADLAMEAMAGLYGVLLAFLLAGAWEHVANAREALRLEASSLASLRRIAPLLPSPVSAQLSEAAHSYQVAAREEIGTRGRPK